MTEMIRTEHSFVGYEYKDVIVKQDAESLYTDGYAHFGWILEATSTPFQNVGSVTMKFKRYRKIRNKAELTRLQRQFESCVTEIATLERSKIMGASAVAYIIGIVGTACMAGSVFAYQANMLPLTITLAIPGFAGWIIPYFSYCRLRKKKSDKVTPYIDKKYDEIYEVCEKANGLLTK